MSTSIDYARIKEIQRLSRQGEHGEWRKEFDRRYRELLEESYEEVRTEAQRYVASSGEEISCGKGCSYCCDHFVSVPVTHAIVVADYLYASEKAMAVFLRGYAKWRDALDENPLAASVFAELQKDTALAAEVKKSPQEVLSAYHALNVRCPFLDHEQCAIYAVRPLVCAAYFAVSPPEFCASDSELPAALMQVTPSQTRLRKMAQMIDPRLSMHQESLPEVVYQLLTKGLIEVGENVEKLFGPLVPPQP
jgi:Fe-S-cluster containining protein